MTQCGVPTQHVSRATVNVHLTCNTIHKMWILTILKPYFQHTKCEANPHSSWQTTIYDCEVSLPKVNSPLRIAKKNYFSVKLPSLTRFSMAVDRIYNSKPQRRRRVFSFLFLNFILFCWSIITLYLLLFTLFGCPLLSIKEAYNV